MAGTQWRRRSPTPNGRFASFGYRKTRRGALYPAMFRFAHAITDCERQLAELPDQPEQTNLAALLRSPPKLAR